MAKQKEMWYTQIMGGVDDGRSPWFHNIRMKIQSNRRIGLAWPLLVSVVDSGYSGRYARSHVMWIAGEAILKLRKDTQKLVAMMWRPYRDISVDVFEEKGIYLPSFNGILTDTELEAIRILAEPKGFDLKLAELKENPLAAAVYAFDCRTQAAGILRRYAQGKAEKYELFVCARKNERLALLGAKPLKYPDGFEEAVGIQRKAQPAAKEAEQAEALPTGNDAVQEDGSDGGENAVVE